MLIINICSISNHTDQLHRVSEIVLFKIIQYTKAKIFVVLFWVVIVCFIFYNAS